MCIHTPRPPPPPPPAIERQPFKLPSDRSSYGSGANPDRMRQLLAAGVVTGALGLKGGESTTANPLGAKSAGKSELLGGGNAGATNLGGGGGQSGNSYSRTSFPSGGSQTAGAGLSLPPTQRRGGGGGRGLPYQVHL